MQLPASTTTTRLRSNNNGKLIGVSTTNHIESYQPDHVNKSSVRASRQSRRKTVPSKYSLVNVPLLCMCLCILVVIIVVFYLITNANAQLKPNIVETEYINRGELFGGWRPVLPSDLRLEKLQCQRLDDMNPLAQQQVQEMVYWQNIPQDHLYQSPFYDMFESSQRYLTFEVDGGGFNNIRMAFETILAMAHAMGRTLVLPPSQEMYLLYDQMNSNGEQQKEKFDVTDFFPIEDISKSHNGVDIITMEEFLVREAMVGNIINRRTGTTSFPPNNRTKWDGDTDAVTTELNPWLENVTFMADWNPDQCLATFPVSRDPDDATSLQMRFDGTMEGTGFPSYSQFIGVPTPVYASAYNRMAELMNGRTKLCIYNNTMVHERFLHFHGKVKWGGRLLVHFYSFLFFEDWRQDLWTKRFIRDNLRYKDEIQCAAARIVLAIRERTRSRDLNNYEGHYDAFHIRRGEFQYKKTRVSAKEIYEIASDIVPDGATVYIATDESNKEFFHDLGEHYDLVFLDDFHYLLGDINTNYYGMIDQLVASRSRNFFGCWFSTFTSYINRLRGYQADRLKANGFGQGIINSYYYTLPEKKMVMQEYWPISGSVYAREFPVSWRNIDQGIEELSKPLPY